MCQTIQSEEGHMYYTFLTLLAMYMFQVKIGIQRLYLVALAA